MDLSLLLHLLVKTLGPWNIRGTDGGVSVQGKKTFGIYIPFDLEDEKV